MAADKIDNFNIIINHIINESLFTKRQIQIITNDRSDFHSISHGAYYRQRIQARQKVRGVLYSMVLLQGLGLLPPNGIKTTADIADKINVIFNSDIGDGASDNVIKVIDEVVTRIMDM